MKSFLRTAIALAVVLVLLVALLMMRMHETNIEEVVVREIETVRLASLPPPPPVETPPPVEQTPPSDPPPPPPPPPATPPPPDLEVPPLPLELDLPEMEVVESAFPLIALPPPPPEPVLEPPPPPTPIPEPIIEPPTPRPVYTPPPPTPQPIPTPRPSPQVVPTPPATRIPNPQSSIPPPATRIPPPASRPAAIQASELDSQPRLLNRPSVRFPSRLSRRGVRQGEVLLQVQIDPAGRVTVDKVIRSSHPELVETARSFATKARFTKPTKNGKPVKATFQWPLVLKK